RASCMCSLANDGKVRFEFPVCKVLSPSCESPPAVPGLDCQEVIALVGGAMVGCARPATRVTVWLPKPIPSPGSVRYSAKLPTGGSHPRDRNKIALARCARLIGER